MYLQSRGSAGNLYFTFCLPFLSSSKSLTDGFKELKSLKACFVLLYHKSHLVISVKVECHDPVRFVLLITSITDCPFHYLPK